jgi:hypothetical protein
MGWKGNRGGRKECSPSFTDPHLPHFLLLIGQRFDLIGVRRRCGKGEEMSIFYGEPGSWQRSLFDFIEDSFRNGQDRISRLGTARHTPRFLLESRLHLSCWRICS